jgi:hypothetical protein
MNEKYTFIHFVYSVMGIHRQQLKNTGMSFPVAIQAEQYSAPHISNCMMWDRRP